MRLPATSNLAGGPNHIYLAAYKEWLAQQPLTPNTVRAYHSRVKQFLCFLEYANLQDQLLDQQRGINKAMGLYLQFLKQANQLPTSVNASINALNHFASFIGLAETELRRERCYYQTTRMLTLDEQARFLQSVEKQEYARDKALSLVLFYSGVRVGDCARLNVADIATGVPCIVLGDGATIPLNAVTTIALRRWLEERSKLGSKEDSGLWLTESGKRLSISGITFVIKRIGWQAKLVISPETLRRTRLANVTDHLNATDLALRFGGCISAATVNRYGISWTSFSP